jgi:hypothetical protein
MKSRKGTWPSVPFDHPEYENHDHLTVEMIEGLLRDKICSATRADVGSEERDLAGLHSCRGE